ncbi:hypothetical protein STEG23_007564 [Scotinomys teguina]
MSAVMLLPGTNGSLLLVQRTVTRTIVLQETIGKVFPVRNTTYKQDLIMQVGIPATQKAKSGEYSFDSFLGKLRIVLSTSVKNCVGILMGIVLNLQIAFAKTSSTILNKYGESGQPCLVPDFSGIALSFSPFNLMVAVGLL